MGQWHREHPELVGTYGDPWMIHEDYRRLIPRPESEREQSLGGATASDGTAGESRAGASSPTPHPGNVLQERGESTTPGGDRSPSSYLSGRGTCPCCGAGPNDECASYCTEKWS